MQFFLGYATESSDLDMFRPSRRAFVDFVEEQGDALNAFIDGGKNHLTLFDMARTGPLALGNFTVHGEITLRIRYNISNVHSHSYRLHETIVSGRMQC